MLTKSLVIVTLGLLTTAAFADESTAREAAKQVIALQDGSTAYVFDNGKMAVENKVGEAIVVKPGTILKTSDGTTIAMVGDEVGRLNALLRVNRES
jgi:hypothetical protein